MKFFLIYLCYLINLDLPQINIKSFYGIEYQNYQIKRVYLLNFIRNCLLKLSEEHYKLI
jgi:hypothetical protein